MIKINRENINSFLIVFFMFSSAICLPIHTITNSGFMIWIVTFGILFASLAINKFTFNKKMIYVGVVLISIFLLNLLIFDFKDIIKSIFIEFIKFALIPLYLMSVEYKFEKIPCYWYKMGLVNFVIWILMIKMVYIGKIDYMFFGVYMTYSFIIFIYNYYKLKKRFDLFLSIMTLVFIFMFGNRAAWGICIAIWGYLYFIFNNKSISKIIIKTSILIIGILYIYNNFIIIMSLLKNFLARFNINSYSVSKLINAYNNGFITTISGRDELYSEAINIINNANAMPMGIGYFSVVTGKVYPHNFIFEYIISFGIIGIVVVPFIIIYFKKKYKLLDREKKVISNMLLIFVLIRLSMSSSFFIETILWIWIGMLIFNKNSVTRIEEGNNNETTE